MADDVNDDEEYSLKIEAKEVVKEVSFAVAFVEVSTILGSSDEHVFLNIETKEGEKFCVELSVQGFQVVGSAFDNTEKIGDCRHYETIYALLDTVSPGYRNTFGDTLMQKLQSLQERKDDQPCDDSGPT